MYPYFENIILNQIYILNRSQQNIKIAINAIQEPSAIGLPYVQYMKKKLKFRNLTLFPTYRLCDKQQETLYVSMQNEQLIASNICSI